MEDQLYETIEIHLQSTKPPLSLSHTLLVSLFQTLPPYLSKERILVPKKISEATGILDAMTRLEKQTENICSRRYCIFRHSGGSKKLAVNGNIHLENILTLPVGGIRRYQRLIPFLLLSYLLPPAGNLPTASSGPEMNTNKSMAPHHCISSSGNQRAVFRFPSSLTRHFTRFTYYRLATFNCGYDGLHPSAVSVCIPPPFLLPPRLLTGRRSP